MKHLKPYKTFETIGYSEMTDEIWSDISDILLELEDVGFQITKDVYDVKRISNKLCSDVVEIAIDKKNIKSFSFSEIEEAVRRLIHYMSQYKWNYTLLFYKLGLGLVEFESGGEHPLISNKKFSTEAEKMLHKYLNDCQGFKIAFYQSIDRIIEK